VIKTNPVRWNVWHDMGNVFLKMANYRESLARLALARGLVLWPESYYSWHWLGCCYRNLYGVAPGSDLRTVGELRHKALEYLTLADHSARKNHAPEWETALILNEKEAVEALSHTAPAKTMTGKRLAPMPRVPYR
jgi:hypothetical protein